MKKVNLFSFLILCYYNVVAQRERIEFTVFYWEGEGRGNGIPSVFMVGTSTQVDFLRGVDAPGQTAGALDWRAHFAIGVPVNHTLYIHPEIAFSHSQRGNKINGISMTSMELPLQLGVPTVRKKEWMFKAGAELSLAISGDQHLNGSKTSFYNNAQQTQWFLSSTLEYLPNRLGISVRYRHGLTKISEVNTGALAGKFSSLSFGAIYRLAKNIK